MKRLFTFFLLATFLSCGSIYMPQDYGMERGWGFKEIPPSEIYTVGTIYEGKLSYGKTFTVGGNIQDPDATYYYNILMKDFGWTREGDKFTGYYGTTPTRGRLYINLKREVAIYFYPKETFDVFRITINTPEED